MSISPPALETHAGTALQHHIGAEYELRAGGPEVSGRCMLHTRGSDRQILHYWTTREVLASHSET